MQDLVRRWHGDAVDHLEEAERLQQHRGADDHQRSIKCDPGHAVAALPIVFSDSSRSDCHSRLVIVPNAACSMMRLSRLRGHWVSTVSTMRPGRADITAMRSA